MNTEMQTTDLSQYIKYVMESVEMSVPLREVHDGINMSYNFIGKYIGFDPERLPDSHTELAPFCSFETYVQVMTLHELGHVIDHAALQDSLTKTISIFTMKKSHELHEILSKPELFKLLIEENEMNMAFEITAWDNATLLNERFQLVEAECFNAIRKNSLATYERLYETDLTRYHSLLSKKSMPTA
ncbi:integrase [Sporosarcina sp.]|uniref:integrase n=1 Tax=Sporosarcina sp. TaxID=49982 RepID=UPI00260D9329|nr:integrase [Sporosarcina sp.]